MAKPPERFWDRLVILMKEHGDTPSSLSMKIDPKPSKRDLVRQIGERAETKPDAAVHAKTADAIARIYDVSPRWLTHGGPDRGKYGAPSSKDELAAHAAALGVHPEVVDYVLATNPGVSDGWALFNIMHGLETARRAGATLPERPVASVRKKPR